MEGDQRTVSALVRRYEDGRSIRGLAGDTGRSYRFVRQTLLEGGARLRPRGAPPVRGETPCEGLVDLSSLTISMGRITGDQRVQLGQQVAQLYRQGATVMALAKKLGRSDDLVRRLLREQGVAMRPAGPRPVRRAQR